MRKIKLYIAMSLNGKIATEGGNVSWIERIPNPQKDDYGYGEFYSSIDTTIQGYATYKQIINWGIDFPYAGKKNYVLTRQKVLKDTEYVEFICQNHIDFIKKLKKETGKDIWLIGGGQINTLLLNANLIDEIIVFVMPIILTDGIEVFENLPKESLLKLIKTKTYDTGAVELKYEVK